MKKNTILSLVASAVALVIFAVAVFFIYKGSAAKYDGNMTIVYQPLEGDAIEKKVGFNEGDTSIKLIEDNFNGVKLGTGSNTGMILEIEGYVSPSDWSTFLAIYVNDEMSMVGILEITPADGMKLELRVEENMWA